MRTLVIPLLLAISFVAAGCASGGSGGEVVLEVSQLSHLTEADLAKYQHYTALGVIRTLRPEWVATDPDRIRVFCEPGSQRGLGDLQGYMVREIKEIRYHPKRHTTGNHSTYAYIKVTLKG